MANGEHVAVNVEALRKSMDKQLGKSSDECKRSVRRSIFKVPLYVREQNKSDYEPKLISIGPYHHGAEALKAMESLKWSYLHDLIARSAANSLDRYINIISDKAKKIREYYSEEMEKMPDAELVEMMVLDGCFIVEFLIKYYLKEKDHRIGAKWNLILLQHDLLLLENQIPFLVLRKIFGNSTVPRLEDGITLQKLALTVFVAAVNNKVKSIPHLPECERPRHLLHLCHQSYRPPPPVNGYDKPRASCFSNMVTCQAKEGQSAPKTIRTATELKDAGVKFRRKKKQKNNADIFSLLDVTFRGGTMEIPKLSIREATPSWLRNLLAFEQCYPKAGGYFTSYTALLNNLVDTPNDVAVLKRYDIIKSKLGGDDEVAKLINELCRGAYLAYDDHHFVQLFKDVKQYSEAARHRWRAKLVHQYFESPWAIISVTAAVILLALTLAQTFFTIFPYFHPRS